MLRRALLVYHSNFFKATSGVDVRILHIVQLLQELGVQIDLFVPKTLVESNWETINSTCLSKVHLDTDANVSEDLILEYVKATGHSFAESYPESQFSLVDNLAKVRLWDVLRHQRFDLVLFSYLSYSSLIDELPPEIWKVLLLEDFLSIQYFQSGNPNFAQLVEEEIFAVRRFDAVLCISTDEMAFFSHFVDPAKLVYFPHFTDQPAEERRRKDIDIFFLASDNFHNQRGIHWFLKDVYPRIKDARYKMVFAGKIVNHVDRANYPEITFYQNLEAPASLYQRARLVICPLLSGTGLKIKIVEAMSHGIPVVCTYQSLIGFPNKYHNGCLIANDAESFAEAIHRILQNQKIRQALTRQSKKQYEDFFTWSSAKTILSGVLLNLHRSARDRERYEPEFTLRVAAMKAERDALAAERDALRNAYKRVVESRSWKLTRKLWVLSRLLRNCGRFLRPRNPHHSGPDSGRR